MIIPIWIFYLIGFLAAGFIGYYAGDMRGFNRGIEQGFTEGAYAIEETLYHVAPDMYPEIVKRSNEHTEDSIKFHETYGGSDGPSEHVG